jgi:ribosome-binding ATPase
MSLSVGIVGLPNVGKSTLFNALLKKQAALAANYPFATIEPNVGVVPVPDDRLNKLAEVVHTSKIVPATVTFVDIAGLVAGASKGEGLGNKFLSHIREVDAIAFVLRDFSDENVIRSGSVEPQSDFEILQTELILADLETATKARENKDKALSNVANKVFQGLELGTPARELKFTDEEMPIVKQLNLLTLKPVIKVLNVDEDKIQDTPGFIVISAKLESELGDEIKDLGIEKSGLEKLITAAYDILNLQSFLTAGEIEARAWTIKKGTKAPQAAGVIHNDFEKHFIKADCINWQEFINFGGWQKAREAGKVRTEGREYVMQEGDVVEFKVGV